jgi:hypothetical protein
MKVSGSKAFSFGMVVAVLATAGAVLDWMVAPAWLAARARQPALQLNPSMAAAGQGVTLALLGGFRALVADALWIRMYVLWERRDLPGTQSLIQLVTAVDPRPVYFWINGARILANDLAAWRIEAAGGYDAIGEAVVASLNQQQAAVALSFLNEAMTFHPASAELWIERANIQLHRMRDPGAAAESYGRAWEQPRAPYYAARLHAEMLRRAGRKAEALAFLVRLHPTLPPNDDGAARETVLERIRDLERELNVPPEKAYQPPP